MSKKYTFSLFRKKPCWKPTFVGWILIIIILIAAFRLSLTGIYHLLVINSPVESKTLIIEGFVPTYLLDDAVKLYHENDYDKIVVTGMPITNYEFITPYKNTAEATKLALKHYGLKDSVYIATIPSNVYIDRTYHTALSAKKLFEDNNWSEDFNIFSVGVHSRRSRMMFREAFGSGYKIGIIAAEDRTFLPNRWWKSSKGLRSVSNEFIATIFVSLFFHPDYKDSYNRMTIGNYIDSINITREEKLLKFTDSTTSRFNSEERENFKGFKYYDPNIDYKVMAGFEVDTSSPSFGMKTSTDRVPEYRTFGYIDFIIDDTSYRLAAYQNLAYSNHPVYGNYLFIPFKDLTNTYTTYGAGRYIDLEIPDNDSVIIDFNTAYNPYCAYYDRWSCPLVPFENHLDIKIEAGEKKYK